jgi:Na+/H+ antiporter NhaC
VFSPIRRGTSAVRKNEIADVLALRSDGDEKMLGIIAVILIILWLLGFFAFHVTTAFIHAALVVGLILLVLHFVTGSRASD